MTPSTVVLGLNVYHGDASAALVRDGVVLAAVAEERLRRIKHWAGFPALAVRAVVREAQLSAHDVTHAAVARNSRSHLARKLAFTLQRRPSAALVASRLRHVRATHGVRGALADALAVDPGSVPRIHRVEHHRAHLASAVLTSPFEEAACCAIDGFGDFVSTSVGIGRAGSITILGRVHFPHSLGLLYTAIAQYLGFEEYGDEYKVMALAGYGGRRLVPTMQQLVTLTANGGFRLSLEYFRHWSDGATMEWDDGYPSIAAVYTPALEALLGPRRRPGEPLERRHQDVAHAVQTVFEDAVMHVLRALWDRTQLTDLCLAGGCALNAVANAQIPARTPFRRVFVPPAAGDDGTAVGAALDLSGRLAWRAGARALPGAALGPGHDVAAVEAAIGTLDGDDRFAVERLGSVEAVAEAAAESMAAGRIVAWYEGRSEWGARALGQRSIVADPSPPGMRDRINRAVKGREAFRPLAPSVLWDAFDTYFEGVRDPFMTRVARVRPEWRGALAAVTHVDGTARVHAVARAASPAYHRLIEAFAARTKLPVILNTSFNEREPIVDTPAQAVACFRRAGIDVLVLDRTIVRRVITDC